MPIIWAKWCCCAKFLVSGYDKRTLDIPSES
jgi:hypothetical protein